MAITDKSGAAGIAQWVNTHLRLTGERRVDKRDPLVTRVKDWVDELYAQGRITSIANEEMEHAVRRFMPHLFVSEFDRIKKRALEMAEDLIQQTAERPDIRPLDPQAMAPVLSKLVLENRFIQFAYVTDLSGRIVTPFVTQPSLSSRYRTAPLPDSFADRSWFQKPLEDGKIHVTEFYVSYVTGVLCLTVSAPVFGMDERVAGILGFDIQFEDLVRADDLRALWGRACRKRLCRFLPGRRRLRRLLHGGSGGRVVAGHDAGHLQHAGAGAPAQADRLPDEAPQQLAAERGQDRDPPRPAAPLAGQDQLGRLHLAGLGGAQAEAGMQGDHVVRQAVVGDHLRPAQRPLDRAGAGRPARGFPKEPPEPLAIVPGEEDGSFGRLHGDTIGVIRRSGNPPFPGAYLVQEHTSWLEVSGARPPLRAA